jgi:hypothetical protein
MHALSVFVVFDLLEEVFEIIDLYLLDFQEFSVLVN